MKRKAREKVLDARPAAEQFKVSLVDEFFGGVVAIVLSVCYLAIIDRGLPETLSGALMLILGSYFGTVASHEQRR